MANKFTLKGHQIEVDYTIGGNPTFPSLKYKRGTVSKSFTPSEIHTDTTALGSLVSVTLVTISPFCGATKVVKAVLAGVNVWP